MKQKMKSYYDKINKSTTSDVKVGDSDLIWHKKENKLSTTFKVNPYTVT